MDVGDSIQGDHSLLWDGFQRFVLEFGMDLIGPAGSVCKAHIKVGLDPEPSMRLYTFNTVARVSRAMHVC